MDLLFAKAFNSPERIIQRTCFCTVQQCYNMYCMYFQGSICFKPTNVIAVVVATPCSLSYVVRHFSHLPHCQKPSDSTCRCRYMPIQTLRVNLDSEGSECRSAAKLRDEATASQGERGGGSGRSRSGGMRRREHSPDREGRHACAQPARDALNRMDSGNSRLGQGQLLQHLLQEAASANDDIGEAAGKCRVFQTPRND